MASEVLMRYPEHQPYRGLSSRDCAAALMRDDPA
jgi:hypothetical protein